jgi:signal transduction histidine kinase
MLPHELRTPLNGILSNAELLAHSSATLKPEEIAEIGLEIHKSSERLERLVENFLICAQLELIAADPKNVNALRIGKTEHPAPLVKKNALAQAMHAGRAGDLTLEAADVPVPMSEAYFSKVVNELVHNALKFSEPGSAVQVKLTEMFNGVALVVSDKGRGFSAEEIARIGAYIQFERKKKEQQGLGLGLTIAKRLMELHGGMVSIESEKGAGATVTAVFPKAKTN